MSLPKRFSAQRGPRASHNALRTLRACYGLTQDWLAGFLGVPRTAISMEESVGRGLTWRFDKQLLAFYQQLPAAVGRAPEPAARPTAAGLAAARSALADRRVVLQLEQYRLGQARQKLDIRLRQARLRLQALPALLAALPPEPAAAHARRALGYWATDAPAELTADEAALTLLDLRQRVLEFELGELERLLNEPAAGS